MKTEELKCTYCGSGLTLKSEGDKSVYCKYCGRTMQLEDSKDFAERYGELIKQGHEIDLISMRKSIKTMVEERGAETSLILSRLEKLLMFLPQDTEGNYYKAFYQRKRDPHTYEDKLKKLQCGKEKEELFKHMLKAYDHRYDEGIKAFIENNYIGEEKVNAKAILAKQRKEAENAFERYENIKRDVFICHSSNDKEIVERVQRELESEGIVTWVSYNNMPWDTDNYWINIENAIDKCTVFLAISSEGSMRKKDVIKELELAEEKEKKRMELRIDRSVSTLKFKEFFNGCQWINLQDYETEDEAFEALKMKFYKLQREIKEEEKKKNQTINIEEAKERERKLKAEAEERERTAKEEAQKEIEKLKAELEKAKTAPAEPVKKEPQNVITPKSTKPISAPTITTQPKPILTEPKKNLNDFEIKNGVLNTYRGKEKEVIIPSSVTAIGGNAFLGCTSLTSITIPNSVTAIWHGAFLGCSALTCITIPNGVTAIGESAFLGCSALTSITIPSSATAIGEQAFSSCKSLISITIPNSVKKIGGRAFKECSSLTSITIPNSVTEIGDCAFNHCDSLTSITIPNSVTEIGGGAFEFCSSLKSITIPNSIKKIGTGAFRACTSLTSITIPNGVTAIWHEAFWCCSALTNIIIPNSVTTIWNKAFNYCESLKEIIIEGGEKQTENWETNWKGDCNAEIIYKKIETQPQKPKINLNDFRIEYGILKKYNGTEKEVTIPNSVTEIGNYAFYECSALTSITIPNSVMAIGERAFLGCKSLTSITIPNSVTEIGVCAFFGCSKLNEIKVEQGNAKYIDKEGVLFTKDMKTIIAYPCGRGNANYDIPSSVKTIGEYAFFSCYSLTSITIPNSVTEIGKYAYACCSSLTSITIPNSVKTIGEYAFFSCCSLTSITIPNSVTAIGGSAFSYFLSLKEIIIEGGKKQTKTWDKGWRKVCKAKIIYK